jgi:hypothetical protein
VQKEKEQLLMEEAQIIEKFNRALRFVTGLEQMEED